MKKKFLAILLATAMVFSMAACGEQKENVEDSSVQHETSEQQTETSEQQEEKREPLEITIAKSGAAGSHDTPIEDAFIELVSEKLNREVIINYELYMASEYASKVGLMFSTGDLPDLISVEGWIDFSQAVQDGYLLDLSEYKDLFPNYWNYMEKTTGGIKSVTYEDGSIYKIESVVSPTLPEDSGISPSNVTSYRYDVFEKHNIEIPETMEELYEAAKKLKELYPDSYPINVRYGFDNLLAIWNVRREIYWDGEEFVQGLFSESYKEALTFLNKLYEEGLLDPEFVTDDDDTTTSKMLNGKSFVSLDDFIIYPGVYNANATEGQTYCYTLLPGIEGSTYQMLNRDNEWSVNIFAGMVASADTKDPEGLVEFLNVLYSEEVTELLSWGIEGETFQRDENGNKVFIDEIMSADSPYEMMDVYGLMGPTMSPGHSFINDSKRNVALTSNDTTNSFWRNGEMWTGPLAADPFLLSIPAPSYPENPYTTSWWDSPSFSLSEEQSAENSHIITAVNTVRDEWELAIVTGQKDISEWGNYMKELKAAGDIQKVIDSYNAALEK